jgi:hypothetical protein
MAPTAAGASLDAEDGVDHFGGAAPPRETSVELIPKCASNGGGFGYVDAGGRFRIPPIYRAARPFCEGRAAVFKGGAGWGLIDANGRYILPPSCASIQPFSEGLAAVQPNRQSPYRWVYVDRAGRAAIDMKRRLVRWAFPFHEGKAWISCPYWYTQKLEQIDSAGNVLRVILPR